MDTNDLLSTFRTTTPLDKYRLYTVYLTNMKDCGFLSSLPVVCFDCAWQPSQIRPGNQSGEQREKNMHLLEHMSSVFILKILEACTTRYPAQCIYTRQEMSR